MQSCIPKPLASGIAMPHIETLPDSRWAATHWRLLMPFPVGSQIWDLPSGRVATIVTADPGGYYTLSTDVPLDPTGDGAFPTRNRCEHELCSSSDTATIQANTPFTNY